MHDNPHNYRVGTRKTGFERGPCRPCAALMTLLVLMAGGLAAAEAPAAVRLEDAVRSYFATRTHHRSADLLTRSQVQGLFRFLNQTGIRVPDEQEILSRVPDDHDFLVRTLETAEGKKFLSKVAAEPLIYDRLDRIAHAAGGQAMLRDLVKLPDGDRYAKQKRAPGVPDLLDLLPKDRSGKRRQIKDYERPTGRIYTVDALIEQLN